jgi:hypothetical protein
VSALYYKIIPFLVWNTYFGPLAGKRDLPRVADLYPHGMARIAAALLFVGTTVLLVGVMTTAPGMATAGAFGFTAGVTLMVTQMFTISRKRP